MKISNSVENRTLDRLEGTKTRKTEEAKAKKADGPETATATASEAATPHAKMEISGRAKEMANAKAAALSAPDVREDRVAELKKKIQNKEYNVSPEAIADKLLKEHLETGKMG